MGGGSEGYRPVRLTFKAFLSSQEDDITEEEAALRFSEYKLDLRRQQLSEFFSSHSASAWFRQKYQPVERRKRAEDEEKLVRLLNTVVIKLEEGSEAPDKVEEEATPQLHLTRSLLEGEGKGEGGTEADQLCPALVAKLSTERDNKLKSLAQTEETLLDEEAVKLGTGAHSALRSVLLS